VQVPCQADFSHQKRFGQLARVLLLLSCQAFVADQNKEHETVKSPIYSTNTTLSDAHARFADGRVFDRDSMSWI